MKCPLCHSKARVVFSGYPAFAAPDAFSVGECEACDTRFAVPLTAGGKVYDLIYKNSQEVPGYDRYRRYAVELPRSSDPLGFMASQEDVYWAIKANIDRIASEVGRPLRVLEVGSGYGYLTYSLNRAGHDARGIDISEEAVRAAVERFGPMYTVGRVESFAQEEACFDLVVATEVVEHVEDPVTFLRGCMQLVAPEGSLLITTPNKDLYPRCLAWHTDPAPVHLWWFSKSSMRRMAWAIGASARFTDFSGFYSRPVRKLVGPSKPQTFDEHGRVVFRDTLVNTLARRAIAAQPGLFKAIGRVFLRRLAKQRAADEVCRESLSLCVELRRTG